MTEWTLQHKNSFLNYWGLCLMGKKKILYKYLKLMRTNLIVSIKFVFRTSEKKQLFKFLLGLQTPNLETVCQLKKASLTFSEPLLVFHFPLQLSLASSLFWCILIYALTGQFWTIQFIRAVVTILFWKTTNGRQHSGQTARYRTTKKLNRQMYRMHKMTSSTRNKGLAMKHAR